MNTPWPGPTMVTLIDGRIVFSDAEEWRRDCEIRSVAAMSDWEAAQYIAARAESVSQHAADELALAVSDYQRGRAR